MLITKHGNVVRFVCEACGCEFVEAKKYTQECGFFIRASCPECGREVRDQAYGMSEEEKDGEQE